MLGTVRFMWFLAPAAKRSPLTPQSQSGPLFKLPSSILSRQMPYHRKDKGLRSHCLHNCDSLSSRCILFR